MDEEEEDRESEEVEIEGKAVDSSGMDAVSVSGVQRERWMMTSR